jgi:hypothetical protein
MRTMEILSAVTGGGGGGEAGPAVEAVKLAPFVKTVAAEQQLLNTLQIILAKQVPVTYCSNQCCGTGTRTVGNFLASGTGTVTC